MYDSIPDVLTVLQAAEIMHVGKRAIYNAIHNGELNAKLVGKRMVIPKLCFLDYLHDNNIARQQQTKFIGRGKETQ